MNSFGLVTSLAGAGKVVTPKPASSVSRASKLKEMGQSAGENKGTDNVQTGGRNNLSIDKYFRQEAGASKMYDSIRASTSDVQVISKNTGIGESRIQRSKDHVFNNEISSQVE